MRKYIVVYILLLCCIGISSAAYNDTFTPIMTSNTAPSGNTTTCDTTYPGSYECFRAFDHNNATTMWTSTINTYPHWITLKTPQGHVATNYTMWSRIDKPQDSPRNWTLYGSNDGTNWTSLDVRTSITWSANTPQSFPFSNTVSYTYYNLTVNRTTSMDVCAVSEIYFYETTPVPLIPITSFTASNTSGIYPPSLLVNFTDTSTNTPTSWQWNATNTTGNNTPFTFATTKHPTWYFDIGNFSISLNATNAFGSNVSDQVTWINVSAPTSLSLAEFTGTPLSGTAPLSVTFTDADGTGETSWEWIFGDGNTTGNTEQNPVHLYTASGVYTVNHSATNVIGTNWTNKTGYVTVTNATGFTPQDIWMEGQYLQTFRITDSSTGLPIPVVDLQDTAMQTYTTTNGTGYLTEAFGASTVTFVAEGYYSRAVSYVFDSDETHDVQMTAAAPTSPPQPQSNPVYVAIHFVEGFGTPVSGVAISAVPYSTSTGNFAYLAGLLGIPLDQVPMQNQTMNQTSGTDGKGAFYVLPTTQYNFTFEKTGYTFTPAYMFTSFKNDQDIYIAAASSGASPYFPNGGIDVNDAINYSVRVIKINDTASFLNMSYNDSTATTTGGSVRVITQNNTPYQPNATVVSWPITGATCSNSTVIVHTQEVNGESYLNATTTQFGSVTKSTPFSMKGQAVKFMGFGPEIALLFALFIMMMTVMLGTAQTARQVTFGGLAFEMWVFYAIGWFDSLIARGVPETMLQLGMVIVTVVAIFAIFEVRKKKEKY